MLTISKRTLVQLFALAMGGVGLAMFVGVLVGSQLAQPEVVETQTAAATLAVDTAADPLSCELTPVLSAEEARWLDGLARSEAAGNGSNSATNSGTIDGSQFSDGGFGDIGQQWWNVTVGGDVTNVHVSGNGNIIATNNDITIVPPAEGPDSLPIATPTTNPPAAGPPATTPPATTPPATTPPATTNPVDAVSAPTE